MKLEFDYFVVMFRLERLYVEFLAIKVLKDVQCVHKPVFH